MQDINGHSTKPALVSNQDQKFHTNATSVDSEKSGADLASTIIDKKAARANLKISIAIYKNYKISIYKPLILLKLVQFSWFGAGSFMSAFITVFLKQRGVSLSQLSWMNVVAPVVQLTGTTLTGIIADKMGRSKPVLVGNIILVMAMVLGMILMPTLNTAFCRNHNINYTCSNDKHLEQMMDKNCKINLQLCGVQCDKSVSHNCRTLNSTCSLDMKENNHRTLTPLAKVNISLNFNESCYFDLKSMSSDVICSYCSSFENQTLQIACKGTSSSDCHARKGSKSPILIGYIFLYVIFLTTYSNVYRCFDVTAMTLVKEHDGNFGRERFFAMTGNLMISPLAGLIADATTQEGGERNYVASLYLFLGLACVVLGILYKLPVTLNPPGDKMWRKSLILLKNMDIMSLGIIVLVLGTSWNFSKIFVFWYLEGLNAPSILVGLIPSVSALYGLPFLLTSNWWIRKIGSTHLIIIALLCYVLNSIGYSFLVNPWYSLILEMFGAFTYYLLWVAVVQYSHELAPEGMRATVVAVVGAIHYSVGKSTGGLVSGLIMNPFGGRVAFRVLAVICFVSAVLYGFYLRIRHSCVSSELKLDELSKSPKCDQKLQCIFVVSKTD